jgi:hypothetical protein
VLTESVAYATTCVRVGTCRCLARSARTVVGAEPRDLIRQVHMVGQGLPDAPLVRTHGLTVDRGPVLLRPPSRGQIAVVARLLPRVLRVVRVGAIRVEFYAAHESPPASEGTGVAHGALTHSGGFSIQSATA